MTDLSKLDVFLFKTKEDDVCWCKIDGREDFELSIMPETILHDVLYELGWASYGVLCNNFPSKNETIFISQDKTKELKLECYTSTPDSDWCFKAILYLNNKYLMCYTIPSSNLEDYVEKCKEEFNRQKNDVKLCLAVLKALGYSCSCVSELE